MQTIRDDFPAEKAIIKPNVNFIDAGNFNLQICAILFVSFLCRHLLKRSKLNLPENAFLVIVGLILGTIIRFTQKYTEISDRIDKFGLVFFQEIYFPIIVFRTAFIIDFHLFKKSFLQIIIISLFVIPTNICFLGLIMKIIIDHSWILSDAFLFGSMCIAIHPSIMIQLLESTNYFRRQVIILLQGESLLGLIVSLNIHEMVQYYKMGVVIHWYQFVVLTLRRIVGSLINGCVFGTLGIVFMRAYNMDVTSLFIVSVSLAFLTTLSGVYIGDTWGGIVIVGALMSRERTFLSIENNQILLLLWQSLGALNNVILVIISSIHIAAISFLYIPYEEFLHVCLTLIVDLLGRFISFLIFAPVLSRLGNGLNFTNLLICVLGGVKTSCNLGLAMYIQAIYFSKVKSEIFYFHSVFVFFLFNIVHGYVTTRLLQKLGLAAPPPASLSNMTKCMKYIQKARTRFINSLKLDSNFSQSNWQLVQNMTELAHPYLKFKSDKDEDEDLLAMRVLRCPQCKNKVLSRPSNKEVREMTLEARLRILRADKVIFRRLYESGMIPKSALRTLIHTVEVAMASNHATIELDSFFRLFKKDSLFIRIIRKTLQTINLLHMLAPPKNRFYKFCYNIALSNTFEWLILFIVLLDVIVINYLEIKNDNVNNRLNSDYQIAEAYLMFFFLFIYIVEFIIRVLGGSNPSVLHNGIPNYFKSYWNIADFCLLIFAVANLVMHMIVLLSTINASHFSLAVSLIKLLRIVRILKLIRIFKMPIFKMFQNIENRFDQHIVHAFTVARSFSIAQREVADLLPFIIDNQDVQTIVGNSRVKEQYDVLKRLTYVQNERFDITCTSKTKQAVAYILQNMNDALKELKMLQIIDYWDYDNFANEIRLMRKKMSTVKFFGSLPPMQLFQEINWLEGHDSTTKFLFDRIESRKFNPGEYAFIPEEYTGEVYIIVQGIFEINYNSNNLILQRLENYGSYPIVDYLPYERHKSNFKNILIAGNCIGEYSALVKRPYNCTISSYACSQTYLLTKEVLKEAMALDSDPIFGLRSRMWKSACYNIAMGILIKIPLYSLLRLDKIKFSLERSFVPDLSKYKIFSFATIIRDIILIDGIAVDINTKTPFYGPCYIPRTTEKLIINSGNLMSINRPMETILLIIPSKGIDPRRIMDLQENLHKKTNTKMAHEYQSYGWTIIGMFILVSSTIILRQMNKYFRDPISTNFLNCVLGIILGLVIHQVGQKDLIIDVVNMIKHVFEVFCLPIMIFKTAFCMEFHQFGKSAFQIFVIVFLVLPLNLLFLGYVMRAIIDPEWSIEYLLLFGSMAIAVYPNSMFSALKTTSYFTKQVIILLEGETVFALFYIYMFDRFVEYKIKGIVVWWFQFACCFIRCGVISLINGFVFGSTGIYLTRMFYNDAANLLAITLSLCLLSYNISYYFGGGLYELIITGVIVAQERQFLPTKVNGFIIHFWKTLGYVVNAGFIVIFGAIYVTLIYDMITWHDVPLVFLTYIFDLVGRFLSFFILSPVLSRLGTGLTFQQMIICVWGGTKNPSCLGTVFRLFQICQTQYTHRCNLIVFHLISLFILNSLIQGSLAHKVLKLLETGEPIIASMTNLKSCTKYVLSTRDRVTKSLKVDSVYSDANWQLIDASTKIELPFINDLANDDEDDNILNLRFSICGQCQTNVPNEPSKKEIQYMKREAKLRLLKALRVGIKKLYQERILSKESLKIFTHAIEIGVSSRVTEIDLDGLLKQLKANSRFDQFINDQLLRSNFSMTITTPPNNSCRKHVYKMVTKSWFWNLMLFIIVIHSLITLFIGLSSFFTYVLITNLGTIHIAIDIFFVTLYIIEMILRIVGTWNYPCLTNPLQVILTILEILALLGSMSILIRRIVIRYNRLFFATMLITNALRILRYIPGIYKCILKAFHTRYENNLMHAFSLTKLFTVTQNEIIELIPYLIDNHAIQKDIKNSIMIKQNILLKAMLQLQHRRLDLCNSVKSRHAILNVLNKMKIAIYELRMFGYIDHIEHENMLKSMVVLYKNAFSMRILPFVYSPFNIFKEVVWIDNDADLCKYLFDRVESRIFNPNEILFNEDQVAEGIYLVLSGGFDLHYKKDPKHLEELRNFGHLPVVDYIRTAELPKVYEDVIPPGNSIGVLSTITGHKYNCTITSNAYSHVYIIRRPVIEQAIKMDSNRINGLSCRLWKSVSNRLVRSVLHHVPAYSMLRLEKIAFAVSRSFLPDLSAYKVLKFCGLIKDIILIDGMVMDYYSQKVYIGLSYIPRTVEYLILSNSYLLRNHTKSLTILSIIPVSGVSYEAVMQAQTTELDFLDLSQG